MKALRIGITAGIAAALLTVVAVAWAAGGTLKPWSGGATPPLALRDLDGKEHKLADYKGKVVVLNFWATWCDPCREEMPAMQRLQDKLTGKPFVILAVDYGEGAPRIKDFLKNVPVRFIMLLDRDTTAATAWKVKVLPTSLVIDPQQKVRFVAVGDIGWDTPPVEAEIRKLLPPG